MARFISVFVDSPLKPAAFAQELEGVLGYSLERLTDQDIIFYAFSDGKRWFNVGYHRLENYRDMPFEEFRYQIEVGVQRAFNPDEDERLMQNFAREMYEKFKVTQKYRLMLVDDVQIKLDEFMPIPSKHSSALKDVS